MNSKTRSVSGKHQACEKGFIQMKPYHCTGLQVVVAPLHCSSGGPLCSGRLHLLAPLRGKNITSCSDIKPSHL